VEPVLIRTKWYKNDASPQHASTILVQDEYGIQRVKAQAFLREDLVRHELFVFPKHYNQVFLVPDRLHAHWQLVVDREVCRERPTLLRAPQEVTTSGEGTLQSREEDGNEGLTVESDSEGEVDIGKIPSNNEEGIYQEEIITYNRRFCQPLALENHTLEGTVEEDVQSDEENVPIVDDFSTIET
jgi:hypothetical protein